MAKFCTNCGAPITETTKFCTNCGKPLSVEPAPQTAATPPPQNAEQTVKSTPEQSVRAKPKPAGKTVLGPGAAICGAMLCVTCLPYVLKSLLFLSRRDFLDGMLLLALELLGMAAAAVVLLPGSKRAVGRMQVSAALLLAVLVPGVHAADELLIQQLSLLTPRENLIYAAGLLAVRLIAAGLAGSALRALFVPQTGTKQGGKISAIVCSLAALFAPDLVTLAWSYSPYEDVISFFSTVSCKALAAFVASCGFTAATNCMLRRRPSGQGQPKKSGLLTLGSGIVLAVLSVAAALQGMASRSVAVIAAEDVGGSLSDA
ncbi:MAG: zinc ribbon domain-containing protein, partial [Oscillospiraceae bacterium]|nr:zinc ribbon domain-containing protein [Oscillospiraceae bacterium]